MLIVKNLVQFRLKAFQVSSGIFSLIFHHLEMFVPHIPSGVSRIIAALLHREKGYSYVGVWRCHIPQRL